MVSGLSPTASMAWHCAQCKRANLKPRRSAGDCARAESPAHNTIAPTRMTSLGSWGDVFRTINLALAGAAGSAANAESVVAFGQYFSQAGSDGFFASACSHRRLLPQTVHTR